MTNNTRTAATKTRKFGKATSKKELLVTNIDGSGKTDLVSRVSKSQKPAANATRQQQFVFQDLVGVSTFPSGVSTRRDTAGNGDTGFYWNVVTRRFSRFSPGDNVPIYEIQHRTIQAPTREAAYELAAKRYNGSLIVGVQQLKQRKGK